MRLRALTFAVLAVVVPTLSSAEAATSGALPVDTMPLLFPALPVFAAEDVADVPWELGAHLMPRDSWETLQPVHRRMLLEIDLRRQLDPLYEPPMMCFTPGYPDKAIADFQKAVWGTDGDKFNIGTRWLQTATNAFPIVRGTPITIIYSYVPDGTSIPGAGGEPTSNSDLFSFFETECGYSRATWQARFDEVFDRWEELTGINYVKLATTDAIDDGAAFGNGGATGLAGVRGDVRIGGHSIDGQSGSNTLAYNFYPDVGDMVIDTDNVTFFAGTSSLSLGLRNIVSHEHGHGMGINHVCPSTRRS